MSVPIDNATVAAVAATGLQHDVALADDASVPLVVFVHGRAGNAQVMRMFDTQTRAPHHSLFPQAPLADNIGGWSWWQVDSHASLGSDLESSVVRLREFIQRALLLYQLEPRFCLALGFSQGAALLSALMQDQRAQFAGVALMAGSVIERKQQAGDPARVLQLHGSADSVVPLARAEEGADFLKRRGFDVERIIDPVGHKVGGAGMRALRSWFEGFAL